jgi:hypothetical protein
MARRPAPATVDGALFGLPGRVRGRHERAMEQTVRQWRAAGHAVDPAASSALREVAGAVDLAIAKQDYWHIGNGLRTEAELRKVYGPTSAADPFDAFLASMGDDDGDPAPVEPGPPVRHSPD